MKTRLIVEIEHHGDWTRKNVLDEVRSDMSLMWVACTVTLADSLPVRDTMPEAREAAMTAVQAIGQEIEWWHDDTKVPPPHFIVAYRVLP